MTVEPEWQPISSRPSDPNLILVLKAFDGREKIGTGTWPDRIAFDAVSWRCMSAEEVFAALDAA